MRSGDSRSSIGHFSSLLLEGLNIILILLLLCLGGPRASLGAEPLTVVINEVAWMGTAFSDDDEWIELYNNTDQPINLSSWTLAAADGTPSLTIPTPKGCKNLVIPARGFFLLERTDDTTIKDVDADCIYTGALSNDGEILILKDPTNKVIDTANGNGGGWPAGLNDTSVSPPNRRTMERIDPFAPDSDANWCTNDGVHRNGLDAAEKPINGTPKARNSCTNRPPIADAGLNQEVDVGERVQLDGSGSFDPDGDPLSYSWAFISKPSGSMAALSESPIVNPTFIADVAGTYILKLTVADDRGGTASDQVTIIAIGNQSPTADFDYFPEAPTTCAEVYFADYSDDPDGAIASWDWAFGDGTGSSEQNPEHRYIDPGVYAVTLTVTDDDGASATASEGIEVLLEEGDVDNDCQRTVKDTVLAARFALELLAPNEYQEQAADVVEPCEAIDVRDVVRIAEVALRIKDEAVFICSGDSGLVLGKKTRAASLAAPRPRGQLHFDSVVIPSNGRASLKLSSDMALVGLQVGPEGRFAFDPRVVRVKGIAGLNGFVVFASEVDNSGGRAVFLAAYPGGSRGEDGVIQIELEAVGQAGASSSLQLTEIDLLTDSQGDEIANYRIINGQALISPGIGP